MILASSMVQAAPLVLGVGEQAFVNVRATQAITVTNPQVIKVFSSGSKLHIVARHSGLAEITAGREKIPVVVYSTKLREAYNAVSSWVTEAEGITLHVEPDHLVLAGRALRFRDWQDLHHLRVKFHPFVHVEVRPSEIVLKNINEKVREALRDRSISSATAEVRDGELKLVSSASKKQDQELIRKLADEYDIEEIEAGDGVDLRPMVEIEILIAEVKKSTASDLGLKPPEVHSATILPAGDLSSASVNFNSFTPEFHAILKQGQGRVLANPKLVCRSGEKANFVAGGEIPIKIMSWRNQDVLWKKYGVILEIKPLADLTGAISTELTTEVSLLDPEHKVDGIPGLLTNRISTHFDIRGSKTIALSGLIKSELGRSSTGLPLLSQIPVLGELFKSQDYQNNRTELIVFVTPRLITPEAVPEVTPKPSLFEDEL